MAVTSEQISACCLGDHHQITCCWLIHRRYPLLKVVESGCSGFPVEGRSGSQELLKKNSSTMAIDAERSAV